MAIKLSLLLQVQVMIVAWYTYSLRHETPQIIGKCCKCCKMNVDLTNPRLSDGISVFKNVPDKCVIQEDKSDYTESKTCFNNDATYYSKTDTSIGLDVTAGGSFTLGSTLEHTEKGLLHETFICGMSFKIRKTVKSTALGKSCRNTDSQDVEFTISKFFKNKPNITQTDQSCDLNCGCEKHYLDYPTFHRETSVGVGLYGSFSEPLTFGSRIKLCQEGGLVSGKISGLIFCGESTRSSAQLSKTRTLPTLSGVCKSVWKTTSRYQDIRYTNFLKVFGAFVSLAITNGVMIQTNCLNRTVTSTQSCLRVETDETRSHLSANHNPEQEAKNNSDAAMLEYETLLDDP